MNPTEMDLDATIFTFDDDQSATLWAVRGQLREVPALDTGLHDSNIAGEPTTVAPHETLIAVEYSSDSVTCPSLTNDSASEREDSVTSQYTPPTPVSNSPSLEPIIVTPPSPADVNNQVQHETPRVITPFMAQILAQHLYDEWLSLNHFSSTALPPPAQMIVQCHPVGYPIQVPMYYCPTHYHGPMSMPCQTEFGQPCPHLVYLTPMLPTYPAPLPASQPPPVSNKRTFEFVEPEIPDNFVANPNNHGRWQYDRNGNRHYLNAPKTKRPRTN
jgi:hypothetical protein